MGGGGLCTQADIDAATSSSDPCANATTSDPKGNSVKGSGSIRTLAGFATSGAAKMSSEKWWNVYKNYWGDANYADTFALAALDGTGVHSDGNAWSDTTRGELVKKGIAYQAVWMYVLHEFEDAVDDCLRGDIYSNDAHNIAGDSPHAWDEGWAFYAGSLADSGNGQMIHRLAQKRCKDFGTCKDGITGEANVNIKALKYAELGRDEILKYDCAGADRAFHYLVDQM